MFVQENKLLNTFNNYLHFTRDHEQMQDPSSPIVLYINSIDQIS